MEILINELSLTGQFKDDNKFLDNFDKILKIIKIIDVLGFTLLKEYSFFQAKVTTTFKLDDFLRLRTDRARRMKRFLSKLTYNPPYWNDDQKHDCSKNSYLYHNDNICNTSLAESCERDKTILSFTHNNFLKTDLEILKDGNPVSVYNFIDKSSFLNHLLSISQIEPLDYCQFQFKHSKLNFSLIEIVYGFDSLETIQQKEEFLKAFHEFSGQESWENILKSDGLEYKKYDKPKKKKTLGWFREGKYATKDIYKFRVTQKYRCFGYREKDEFFVLRFEIDHKISDNG
jgi:hypothetical protein